MKPLRVLLLPPGWEAGALQGYPQQYVTGNPFIHLGGERLWGKVSCPRKTIATKGIKFVPNNGLVISSV